MGNTVADGVFITKYDVTLPIQTRDFWGFESSQSWDNPFTAQTAFTSGVSPGKRTLKDVQVITYFKSVVDL